MTTLKARPTDLIDCLLADYKKPEDLIGERGHWTQEPVAYRISLSPVLMA